ncbi:hypothetical protein [Micromonospora sp. NPDC005174]|uniref:hypothetical protein n=1 Tax=Micromonospora sp. NPDC005174 TaxID=3157018 RepID=UPI0033B8A8DA
MLNLPSAEQVREQRKQRATAARRREHYTGRIAAASTVRQRLNEAIDYLRATLARQPEDKTNEAVAELIAMADEAGGVR